MSHIVAFDNARNLCEKTDGARTADINLAHVEHVRRLLGLEVFRFIGTQMVADVPVEEIAQKFNQAGIPVYVLTDCDKDNAPVIIPVANVARTDHYNGMTSVFLKRADEGYFELLVREKPADFTPWTGPNPSGP